jgi:hypothetical protein
MKFPINDNKVKGVIVAANLVVRVSSCIISF